jgi:hypothetical protein
VNSIPQVFPNFLRDLKKKGNIQESTLFRGDSVATKAARAYFRIVALEWLQETLTPMIHTITQHPDESFEVNFPRKFVNSQVDPKKSDFIPNNDRKLSALTLTFLDTILTAFHKFPKYFLNKLGVHTFSVLRENF